MEVFNFMPYTYYTRMTVFGEKVSSAIPLPTIGGVYTHRPQGDTTTLSHAVAVNL